MIKALVLLSLLIAFSPLAEESKSIKILTWSSFIPEKLIKSFEDKTGINIQITEYHDELMRTELLKNNFSGSFDIIIVSYSSVYGMAREHSISRIDYSLLPNYKNMDAELLSKFEMNSHSIVFSYTPMGIVYRKDKITNPPKTWNEFINLTNIYPNKVEFFNRHEDVFDIYQIANNGSLQGETFNDLLTYANDFKNRVSDIKGLTMPYASPNNDLFTGETWAGMTFASYAYDMLEMSDNIGFTVPLEGTKMYPDAITVAEKSNNKDLAHSFINFLMEPQSGAILQNSSYATTTNIEAQKYALKHKEFKEFASSKVIHLENIPLHAPATYDEFLAGKRFYLFQGMISDLRKALSDKE